VFSFSVLILFCLLLYDTIGFACVCYYYYYYYYYYYRFTTIIQELSGSRGDNIL